MKTQIKNNLFFAVLALIVIGSSSCKKTSSIEDEELLKAKSEAIAVTTSAAISSSAAGTSTSATISASDINTSAADSIYAMGACMKGKKKTPATLEALPATVATYLTANYAGYTLIKAFTISTISTSATDSYVVAIQFNGKPAALKFDSSGNFVKVLELREERNMKGPGGWHPGGCFDNRDKKQRDTVAISALPAAIKQYFVSSYAQDTLASAFVNKDGSLIVISKNATYFATSFTPANVFIKRVALPTHPGKGQPIAESALPAASLSYLTNTYPNFVFKKGFVLTANAVIKGYVVIIDANLSKYCIQFDASGQFVAAKPIR